MIIKNVKIFKENKTFDEGDIFISGGLFSDSSDDGIVIDGKGAYAIPGLVDIHFHGCDGYDFCDATPEALKAIAEYEAKNGITSILPASMTLSVDELIKVMNNARDFKDTDGARLLGINLEGPFINEEKKGAQDATHILKPSVEIFELLQRESGGIIKICDIAPETEGAMEFIDALCDKVRISLAHTASDYDTAKLAYEKGAKHATHLYNAMNPFSHRNPGVVGAARDNKNVSVELICDGVHIHPSVIRATFEMFGDDRVVLISDSMRATGLEDGSYTLGGQDVTVSKNLATLSGKNTIAGSVTNLMGCLKFAVKEAGIPLESAVLASAVNPAKCAGAYGVCGSIEKGKSADLVLLDQDLNVLKVILRGRPI